MLTAYSRRSASVARSRRRALRPSREAVAPRAGREQEATSLGGSAPAPPTTPVAASEHKIPCTTWMCDALVSPHKIRWRLSFGCPAELRFHSSASAGTEVRGSRDRSGPRSTTSWPGSKCCWAAVIPSTTAVGAGQGAGGQPAGSLALPRLSKPSLGRAPACTSPFSAIGIEARRAD
eukprot:scaffold53139_cov69-Phaeocystis_antarctica.AAC.3